MFDPDHDRLRLKFWTQVDSSVRHAVSMCWASLPKENQTCEEVEKVIRRLVDRALEDFREDADSFKVRPCG